MTKKSNPLVDQLLSAKPTNYGSTQNNVIRRYGDQPEVLDAIVTAYTVNKLSLEQIARMLSGDGVTITGGSVKGFLRGRGLA